ncbi:Gfo/Idh/MocA family protein [Hydrogenimonas sp.]
MKALVIGYGSIGRRHAGLLRAEGLAERVDAVTSQKSCDLPRRFGTLEEIERPQEYDYFVVANETARHHETLAWLLARVRGKRILVEKPLFHRPQAPVETGDNRVFVAYNLRFHPVIEALKSSLEGQKVLHANILAGQYLPTWRPGRDYRDTYSASVERGGGVLRDLSHELDYAAALFGRLELLAAIDEKVSSLPIDADDLFTALGRTDRGVVVNLTMDYLSKKPMRRIVVQTEKATLEADLIASTLEVTDEKGDRSLRRFPCERNETYARMHRAVLEEGGRGACNLEEGLAVVELIERFGRYANEREKTRQ